MEGQVFSVWHPAVLTEIKIGETTIIIVPLCIAVMMDATQKELSSSLFVYLLVSFSVSEHLDARKISSTDRQSKMNH